MELVMSPLQVTVTEGEDASFQCQLLETPLQSRSGSLYTPVPAAVCVQWYKDDDLIPADDEDFKQSFDGHIARLYIAGTYLDDAGVYACVATPTDERRHKTIRCTATLIINGWYSFIPCHFGTLVIGLQLWNSLPADLTQPHHTSRTAISLCH